MAQTARPWLLAILCVSFVLNVWGAEFGLPDPWHPDEIVVAAAVMARDLSLNPHEFKYGSLHYYQVLVTMIPAYMVSILLSFDADSQKTAVFLAARVLSAALGTGCVALLFFTARQLFGPMTAILSSLFLAVTMGFVNISHFAIVDVPMMFWMLAALLAAAHVMGSGGRRWYLLGGVFAGLAAASKYPGGVVVLSVLAAHILRKGPRDHLAPLYTVVASVVVFVIANPSMVFSSCEFFESFIENAAFHAAEGGDGHNPTIAIFRDMFHAAGPAIAILISLALIYSLSMTLNGKYAREFILVMSVSIAYFLTLLGKEFSVMRYVVPVIPPLLILAGKMLADGLASGARPLRYGSLSTILIATLLSASYTVAANLEFTNDSRKLAAAWIAENVPPGSTIEVTVYSVGAARGGQLPEGSYDIVLRPRVYSDHLGSWLVRMERTSIHQVLYPLFLKYATFAEAAGLCSGERPYFEGWYEKQLAYQENSHANFDQAIEGLERRAPDYVVVSSFSQEENETTPEGRFFAHLTSGKSAYQEVARIDYAALPFDWLNPRPEFVNPTILIFERMHSSRQRLSAKAGDSPVHPIQSSHRADEGVRAGGQPTRTKRHGL